MSDFSFNANQENEFWNKQAERADLEQQKRLENRQRFGVELTDEEYAQINNLIADSENPDQEAHKLGSALLYSKQLGMPIEEAYANIDNYNEALWGTEKSKNYRNSFTAIADMFVIGNNGLKLGNLGNQLQQAEYDGDEEAIKNIMAEIDAINADNELRADNTPRPWYVEALKCGAQTLPFTGEAALVGLFGNFITPGLGTALAFGSSSSLASGQEYIDMRKEGISPETASKVSMMSGAIQGLIEVSLGETTNYLAAGASKTLSKTAAGEIGAKVAENFAKRFHYGPGKKAAISVASAWAADKFGEGLEEATQELTSIISDEVARSMDGLGLDDVTISDKVKQITDAFKGGVVGAIVLGLPFDVANVNANVKDYQSVRATAENIPSEEMFKEAVKDSPVFSNMSDDKKSSVIHDIFENVQREKENEETLRAKEIAEVNKAGDSFENVTVDEETGEAEVEAEYRDENGKLNIQNDIESNEKGIVKGSYRLGNPEQAENNLYGYINYTVDENNKTVTIEAGDFGLSNARENLRQEFYDNFARDYAGYDIQWNTIGTKANDIKQQLINKNPRGKNNGLNYYDSVDGVSINDTRKNVAAQIKKNMPNLSNDEVSAAVVVLEAGAKGLGKNITEYVNDTFGGQIFGDLSEIEEIAQKQGTTFQNKAGASTWKGFGRQMKAVIYAGQYADFSTWCHELAHVYQAQLTGDLKTEAEKAFNVVNGDWYNSKVIGKDGKEMASNEAFAYGFQDWLKTGKAQSQEQANIFQKFAQFISRCLNSLKDFINLSPEIESVYSKLLQADDSMLRAAENAVKEQDAEARRAEIVRKSNEEKQKAQQEKQSQEAEQEENTADSEITIAEEAANETVQASTEETENTENQVKKAVDSVVTPTLTEEEKQAATDVLSDSGATLEDKNTVISDITEDEHIELDALFQTLSEETIQMLAESKEKEKLLKQAQRAKYLDSKLRMYSPEQKALTIKRLTGWEKNQEGKWRYETNDDESFAHLNAKFSNIYKNNPGFRKYVDEQRTLSLGEVLSNSELYDIYSKLPLKDISVRFINDMMQPISSITDKGIILNVAKIDNNTKGINSLLGQLTYQMQKIVQAKDKSAASELEKKLEALRAADRIKMSPGERRNSLFYQHQLSFQDADINTIINQSMTMERAKEMIQRTFLLSNIKDWYEGKYQNGEEWLQGEGVDEVAMYADNEYQIQEKYINPLIATIPELYNGDFTIYDIVEAYKNGTLTGKVKAENEYKIDLSKDYGVKDFRWYVNQQIGRENKELYNIASQRVTESNREEITKARADFITKAHDKDFAESIGITQSAINQKLRQWAAYPSTVLELSNSLNKGVASANKWTGLENSNLLKNWTISEKDLRNMVKDVMGKSSEWQRGYIVSTMLALDTHIDYSGLTYEFGVNLSAQHAAGNYDHNAKKINIDKDGLNTVAHETGHYVDNLWGMELLGRDDYLTMNRSVRKSDDPDINAFLDHFYNFLDNIENSGTTGSNYSTRDSSYWMDPKEVFARFIAKFCEWTRKEATNGRYNFEEKFYKDNFTTAQYKEFVKILQEKSLLDNKKKAQEGKLSFQEETTDYSDYSTLNYQEVTDPKEIERLEKEPIIKAYRAMQIIDGELYPPMSAKVNGKLRAPIKLNVWERSDEDSSLVDENGMMKLNKGNGKTIYARYNPYFHSSPTMLNDQFSEAQDRDNLVTVEVEIPVSELNGENPYKADKAKDFVGIKEWKAGIIQGQLSGTRTVNLSRWDKPIRIVPEKEVAENIIKTFGGKNIIMPSNVVPPKIRIELEKLGISFVNTTNKGIIKDGEFAGDHYSKHYSLKNNALFQETDIDRMQFQTLDELYNDARSFDTWQEFMDFYEVMGKPEVTPIPYDADAQFYQSTWELAHGLQTEQSQNEEEVANKVKQEGTVPTALDALFTTEIVDNDEKLMDFLHMAAYYDRVDLNSDEMKAQSAEDAAEIERISQLKDFIDITFADRNFGTALSAIKGGNEVPPSTLQKIRTEMRDAFKTRDFRALYAEIMDDSEFAVDKNDTIANQLKNRLSKYEKRYYDILRPNEDISRVSPERRKQISLEMDNRDIAAKLKSGSLKMDDEVYRYIKSLDKQIKDLERQYNNLEKETQNDYDRIAGAERRELLRLHDKLLIARSKYNKSNDEITRKINKGIKITDKYTRQSQNLKANYDELFRKYADLKNTIAIDQQVEEALKRQEEVHQVREDLNNKQKERNLTNEIKKLRIQLVKRTMRRVPFDRIDYDSARTLIAIQRLFEPNLMGGVNRWIGTEGPYLRGVISGILTDEEYKKEIMDYMDKTRRSSQAYVEFKELLNNTKTIADFDKWTMKDRKRAALYLPKENWIKDLNLKQLAKEREESIDLPIELKEVKQPVYDEKGNVKKYKDENGEEHDATMTAWKITYSPEIGQMVQDAIGADMFNQLVNVPFADWTTEQLEQLAMRVNRIYTEGKDLLEAKKQAKKDKANEVRRQIEKVVNDTGIQINDDDTPEEKSRKREQINKILGLNTNLKGTVANEQNGIKARINRLLHGYNDANVLRVARILDGQNEGVNVAQLYRREDECYRAKQTAINNRAKEIIDYMAKNNIKESDLSKVVTVNGVEYRIDELLYFLAANEDYEEDPVLLAKGKSGLEANDDYAATSRNAVMFGNMFSDTESLELKATWKELDESTQRRIDDGELTPEEQSLLANSMFEKRPGTIRYIEACKERFGAVINAANQLDEKYKGLLKYISDDYAKQYDRMNEISIKEFNQPVHRVKCYVPLIRLESNGDTNVNQVKEDLLATMGASAGKQWVNKGMTKRRTGMSPLNQRPVQTGLYKTWSDSVERTEHFIAYSEYVNDLNRIYKSRDAVYTRNFIERRYGKGMISYIDDYINEVANPNANRIREAGAELLHTLRGRTAPAYLAWKASAIVKQGLTSPWPYMQFVNPAEYFSAAWKAITSKGKLYDAIRAKSVYMDNRIMDPMNDLIDELAESGKNKFDRAIGKQAQIGMKGLEWIDWVCVAPGWYACYEKKYAELNKNNQAVYESTKARLEEENAYEDVASSNWKTAEQIEALARKAMVDDVEKRAIEYADDCTRACQPSNRKVDIAPLFKNSSEAMKAYLQFQTSLNVIWQNLRYDLPYNLKKKQFAQITGCIIGYALAGIFMNSVMNGLGGDDDDDGNKADDILRNEIYYATTQFTDAIPMIGGDITNTMDKLITGKSGYSQSGTDMTPTVTKVLSIMTNARKGNWEKAAEMTAEGIGMYYGLPVSGIKEIGKLTGVGDLDGEAGINLGDVYGIADTGDE